MKLSTKTPKKWTKSTTNQIQKHPIISFLLAFGILILIIVLGNFLTKPETVSPASPPAKQVQTLTVSRTGSTVALSAQIEKTGVIQLVAQTPGIVQKINYQPGAQVPAYTPILVTSTTYSGGQTATIQRQLAQKQLDQINQTYDLQKDSIAKQREIANQTHENSEKLRDITDASLQETRDLINFNQSLLDDLNDTIEELEANNSDGANDALIATAKQGKSQIQAGQLQLHSALRQAEYQASDELPPADLANAQRDLALKQLEIQEKALETSKEVAELQLKLAKINESLYSPSLPYKSTVQDIHVKVGQSVNPGQALATLSTPTQKLTARVRIPHELANQINPTELSKITIATQSLELEPVYISREATSGQLYTAIYDIPAEYSGLLTDGQHLGINVPVISTSTAVMVPLDALYQTQDQAYVFINQNGTAASQTVTPGAVWGNFVEITSGLAPDSQVIITRNVIAGDQVTLTTN